jgi:hypothetical protein
MLFSDHAVHQHRHPLPERLYCWFCFSFFSLPSLTRLFFFLSLSHGSAAVAVCLYNKTKIRRGFSCFLGRLVDLRRHLRWANQSNWSPLSYSV